MIRAYALAIVTHLGDVVDPPFHNDPAVCLAVVFCNLFDSVNGSCNVYENTRVYVWFVHERWHAGVMVRRIARVVLVCQQSNHSKNIYKKGWCHFSGHHLLLTYGKSEQSMAPKKASAKAHNKSERWSMYTWAKNEKKSKAKLVVW